MKKLLLLALFASGVFGQAVRVDPQNAFTTAANITGSSPPILAQGYANIVLCGYPANGVPCTNLATTYTSATEATSCPNSAQVVLNSASTCQATTDLGGRFGFWVAPGNYSYIISIGGIAFGPFALSAGGTGGGSSGVSSVTGDGSLFTNSATTGAVDLTLGNAAANSFWGNDTSSAGAPAYHTMEAYLDSFFGTTRGAIIYRGVSGWVVLPPGTSGNFLKTLGAGADPLWAAVSAGSSSFSALTGGTNTSAAMICGTGCSMNFSGTGAINATNTLENNGVTYGVSPATHTIPFITAANTAGYTSLTAIMDTVFGSTQGSIVYRNASGWVILAPGTSGWFLETLGAGSNPIWASAGGGGGGAGMAAQLGDFQVTQAGSVLTIGANCSTATPCMISPGNMSTQVTAAATATISGSTSGLIYIWLSTAGIQVGSLATLTCSGCNNNPGTTSFPVNTKPLFTWNSTGGTLASTGTDLRGWLGWQPINVGAGIVETVSGGVITLSLAPPTAYLVSTLPTCNSSTNPVWAVVTDATSPTYNATLTGSGAVRVPVYCNQTAWTSH